MNWEDWVPEWFAIPLFTIVVIGFLGWVLYKYLLKPPFEAGLKADRTRPKRPKFRIRIGSKERQALRKEVFRTVRPFIYLNCRFTIAGVDGFDYFVKTHSLIHRVPWGETDPIKIYSIKDCCLFQKNLSAKDAVVRMVRLHEIATGEKLEPEIGADGEILIVPPLEESVQSFLSRLLTYCENKLQMGALPKHISSVKTDYLICEVIEFIVDCIEAKRR